VVSCWSKRLKITGSLADGQALYELEFNGVRQAWLLGVQFVHPVKLMVGRCLAIC